MDRAEIAFTISALDERGEPTARIVYAPSRNAAIDEVRREGLFPYDDGLRAGTARGTKRPSEPFPEKALIPWLKGYRSVCMTGNLYDQLLESSKNLVNKRLKATVLRMAALNRDGRGQIEVLMAQCPDEFPAWIVGFVRIARSSKALKKGLDRVISILVANEDARRETRKLLAQPKILVGLFYGIIVLFGFYLAPILLATAPSHDVVVPWYAAAFFHVCILAANPIAIAAIAGIAIFGRPFFPALRRVPFVPLLSELGTRLLIGRKDVIRMDAESRVASAIAFLAETNRPRAVIMSMLPLVVAGSKIAGSLELARAYYEDNPGRLAPAFRRTGDFSGEFLYALEMAETAVGAEFAAQMDALSLEFDKDAKSAREDARLKTQARLFRTFGVLAALLILAVFPTMWAVMLGLGNHPASVVPPSPSPARSL